MNFLADENVDRQIVERLRQDGHLVRAVAEMAPGITDDSVLGEANLSSLILITADKDFGELVFRQGRTFGGIVLLRLAGLAPDDKAAVVATVVGRYGDQLRGAFSVVTRRSVRIRQPQP